MTVRSAIIVAVFTAVFAIVALGLVTAQSSDGTLKITGLAVGGAANELHSPADRISESQIKATDDAVVIKIANAAIGRFESTSSMSPLLDNKSTAILIRPQKAADINDGDIIAYQSQEAGGLVAHRVILTGSDEKGWFTVAKGDNSKINDPQKVRFGQIKYVVIGILY